MDPAAKADIFASLHIKGQPLVLTNIWDAGSAKTVASSGAKAIATASWAVAAAQGYDDGEKLPLVALERIVERIAAVVDLPVSVDIEGAYAVEPAEAADNIARIMAAGAIGINVEDGIIGGDGIHDLRLQVPRIAAIRAKAEALGLPLFINARTDLFLQAEDPASHATLIDQAIERAAAFAEAGASGFFAAGLVDGALIEKFCSAVTLPVNILMREGVPTIERLAELGVARISQGPRAYRACMAVLKDQALAASRP